MGRLTAGHVRTVKQPGSYGDGRGGYGLTLLVRPRASGGVRKSWSQRIRIGGRTTNIGLGPYPVVGLAEARKKALANRRMIEQGIDPRRGRTPTFAEAAEQVIEMNRKGWKRGASTETRWRSSFRNYAFPAFGNKPVDEISSGDVLAVLSPIWLDKPALARFLKQRIAAVMRWSVAQGHRDTNPAGERLAAALPKQGNGTTHHRALPHNQVGAALDHIRQAGAANPATALAVEFQILCAVRPSEARLATWSELDLDAATWTIPAERMKAKLEHRVPLSTAAVAVLSRARDLSDGTRLVFPNSRTGGPLGPETVRALLRRADVAAVPHGFRSSFRVWVEECTDTPRSVSEAALAHVNRDQVEAAYLRSDLFDRRRGLMNQWASYIGCSPQQYPYITVANEQTSRR